MDQQHAQHKAIWQVIDDLADEAGLSVSALAMRAGLDSTSLARSKRVVDGVLRWPSSSTVIAVMIATGSSWGDFAKRMEALADLGPQMPPARYRRLIPFAGA